MPSLMVLYGRRKKWLNHSGRRVLMVLCHTLILADQRAQRRRTRSERCSAVARLGRDDRDHALLGLLSEPEA